MAKIYKIGECGGKRTPEDLVKSAKAVFAKLGLKEFMTDIKDVSAGWVMANGLDKIEMVSDFVVAKMSGSIKIQAVGFNKTTSILSIQDNAKIAKIKADALKKSLAACGLI